MMSAKRLDVAWDEGEEAPVNCPLCGGDGQHLGALGSLEWFRCCNCHQVFERRPYQPGRAHWRCEAVKG